MAESAKPFSKLYDLTQRAEKVGISDDDVLREILVEIEKQYSSESDEYIKALNELGGTLKYVGYYDEAEANLLKSLEIIKKKKITKIGDKLLQGEGVEVLLKDLKRKKRQLLLYIHL